MSITDRDLLSIVRRISTHPTEWGAYINGPQLLSLVRRQRIERSQTKDLEWFIYQSLKFLSSRDFEVSEALDLIERPVNDIRFYPVVVSVGEHLIQYRKRELSQNDQLWLRNKLGNAYAQIPIGSRHDHQLLANFHYQKGLELCRDDPVSISQILANLGNVYHEMLGRGKSENLRKAHDCFLYAEQYLQQALTHKLIEEPEYFLRRAMIASGLGNVFRDQQAKTINEKFQKLHESEKWFKIAFESACNDELMQAQVLRNHAVTLMHRSALSGDNDHQPLSKAIDLLNQSLEITSGHEIPFWNSLCQSLRACVLGRLSPQQAETRTEVRDLFVSAVQSFDQLGHRREAVTAYLNWGLFEESLGNQQQAWHYFQEAIIRSESEWQHSSSMSAKLTWAEQYADAIDHYVKLSIQLSQDAGNTESEPLQQEALLWMEKSSARLMTEWTSGLEHAGVRSESEALKEMLEPLATFRQLKSNQRVDHEDELEETSLSVRRGAVRQWAAHDSLPAESSWLEEGELSQNILETERLLGHPILLLRVTSSGTACVLVTCGQIHCDLISSFTHDELSRSLELWQASLQALPIWIRTVQSNPVSNDHGMNQALTIVRNQLLIPLQEWLQLRLPSLPNNLTVVSGPGLAVFPLRAAMTETALSGVPISFSANVRMLRRCLKQQTRLNQGHALKALIVSNPTDDLPFGTWERKVLQKVIPGQKNVLAGPLEINYPTATREMAVKHLKSSDLAIFATHAQFDSNSPWKLSEIHLARSSSGGVSPKTRGFELLDGEQLSSSKPPTPIQANLIPESTFSERLTLADLFDLKMKTSLVMLSACESALTDCDDLANENFGFPSALIAAGARTVIGSLWKIDDLAAALFSTLFFKNLFKSNSPIKTGDVSIAVLKTQHQLRELTATQVQEMFPQRKIPSAEHPFQHPVFWSAFACYGAP